MQNPTLQLKYDEQTEIKKYEGYESNNCFRSLDAKIDNVRKKYENVQGLPEDERPFAETLRYEEI